MSQGKYSKRMLAAAGSLAGLTVVHQVATQAALVHVNDRPISIKFSDGDGTEVQWDIDGVGAAEYSLVVKDSYFSDAVIISSGGLNGQGFVWAGGSNGDAVKALASSFTVGSAAAWITSGTYRDVIDTSSTQSIMANDFVDGGNVNGSNLIGFRFNGGSGVRYGYAEFVFDLPGNGVTINQWWYDDAGAAVHVQTPPAVPEPNTLALLALGAAGVGTYRAARRKIAAADNNTAAS